MTKPGFSSRGGGSGLIFVSGVVLVLLLSCVSYGTNDVTTWHKFARSVTESGLVETYRKYEVCNHPPLMLLMAAGWTKLSSWTGVGFPFLLRLPAVLVYLVLLSRSFFRVQRSQESQEVLAAIALNPVLLLITGYHGNTDTLCAVLCLFSLFAVAQKRLVWGAVLLALAINVKLIAILLLPLLLVEMLRSGRVAAPLGVLVVGAIPFLWAMFVVREAFLSQVLMYRPFAESWGLQILFHSSAEAEGLSAEAIYSRVGNYLVLGGSLLVASLPRWRSRTVVEKGTVCMLLMVTLAPGFGVQYLVYPALLLPFVCPPAGRRYGLIGGVFLVCVYVSFLTDLLPLRSLHDARFAMVPELAGIVVWVYGLVLLLSCLRQSEQHDMLCETPSE